MLKLRNPMQSKVKGESDHSVWVILDNRQSPGNEILGIFDSLNARIEAINQNLPSGALQLSKMSKGDIAKSESVVNAVREFIEEYSSEAERYSEMTPAERLTFLREQHTGT